jgi:predicted nucleic acid-binding protein
VIVGRFSLDSNVLIYTAAPASRARQVSAAQIVERAARNTDCVLTLQALTEFFYVVNRKKLLTRAKAAKVVRDWMAVFPLAGATPPDLQIALDASNAGQFQFYDALLMATAATAGCEAVIGEDMHPGARLGGARVVAAFDAAGAVNPDALALLGG